jgi:hypothetical protein
MAVINPGDPVPVLPASRRRLQSRYFASVISFIGPAIMAAQAALPQLVLLAPKQKWIGPLVLGIGLAWSSIQKSRDVGNTTPVNLSPSVAPPSQTIPEVPPVNKFGVPQ